MDKHITRGDIWCVDLNPTVGHEQRGIRPVLVVSATRFNKINSGLVIIAPLTRIDRRIPFHIAIEPPEGGVRERSFVLCEATRSVSIHRFTDAHWGRIGHSTMSLVEDQLRILLDL